MAKRGKISQVHSPIVQYTPENLLGALVHLAQEEVDNGRKSNT